MTGIHPRSSALHRTAAPLILGAALLLPGVGGEPRAGPPVRRSERASPPVASSSGTVAGSPRTASSIAIGDGSDLGVTLEEGRNLVLLVRARADDTFESLGRRFLPPGAPTSAVAAANPGRRAHGGIWYRLPIELLSAEWSGRVLRAAFPADGPAETGWVHRPGASPIDTYGEGAWQAAFWFAGDGSRFSEVLRANGLTDPLLSRRAEITIPAGLLKEPFRSAWENWVGRAGGDASRSAPPASAQTTRARGDHSRGREADDDRGSTAGSGPLAASEDAEDPAETGDDEPETGVEPDSEPGSPHPPDPEEERSPPSSLQDESGPGAAAGAPVELVFGSDSDGPYASYRLRRGQALYSAVVVRFTGRVDPADVAEAANVIAKRSGIRDVTNIPVGREVRIPLAMLQPEFLPENDSRRRALEQERREAARAAAMARAPERPRNLAGIHVILDAGHGGVDPGARIGDVAEHEYVYDVMCRVKRILETETAATVHPTIEEPSIGFEPRSARILRASGRGRILTTPAHVNDDPGETALGVNLRWFLANSIERRLVRTGIDPANVVFASFHADVLHPSLRGAMIYVPGERYRRGSFACRASECERYAEVREGPVVRFSKSDRLASEGLSREFAGLLVGSMRRQRVRVHPYEPVRDRIIRGGRDWLPAILRGNSVPVKVLVEIANLNNPDDRMLIEDGNFREAVARSFTNALLAYYRASPGPARPPVRARAPAAKAG